MTQNWHSNTRAQIDLLFKIVLIVDQRDIELVPVAAENHHFNKHSIAVIIVALFTAVALFALIIISRAAGSVALSESFLDTASLKRSFYL